MNRLRRWSARVAAVAVSGLVLAGCGQGAAPGPAAADPTDNLEVMSWWTSASERSALQVIQDSLRAANPTVKLVDAAVAGGSGCGSGSNAQVVLADRLAKGDPPDVWQGFVGGYPQAAAGRRQLAVADSAFQTAGAADKLPAAILDAVTVGGKRYGAPTGTHRGNVLFFNMSALTKAGISPPAAGYTLDAFLADLDKAKAAGVTGLCLGGADSFTSVELFENVLLAGIGDAGWAKISRGKYPWAGADIDTALALSAASWITPDRTPPARSGTRRPPIWPPAAAPSSR